MANPLSEADVSRAKGFFGERRTRAHLLFAVAGVALADWLFYGHVVGWTLGAFGALAGLGVLLLGESGVKSRPAFLLGLVYFTLCGRAVVEPEPPVVLLGAAVCALWVLTLRGGWSWSLPFWCSRGCRLLLSMFKSFVLAPCFALVLPLVCTCSLLRLNRLRAWLIPLGLGAVFLGLFASANPVISLALSSVWRGFLRLCVWLPSLPSALRLLFWSGVGALLWTLLRHQPAACANPACEPLPPSLPVCSRVLTPESIRRALAVFNALFAVQTASDLWFLWGGGALPQGMTCAEYAHRGAYPLIVTALLAAAFVLAAFREDSSASEHRAEHRLVYAWLAQNIFLVVSAGWRLWLYVGVFSLSRLRLAAGAWMFLVACGLVWIFVRIFARRSNLWLIQANAVTALAVVLAYSCCLPNRGIANFNVRHCREAGCAAAQPVDLPYLAGLGYDALPALIQLERLAQDTPLAKQARFRIDRLARSLNDRLSDWRGVTLKRWYLRSYLDREISAEPAPVEAETDKRTR